MGSPKDDARELVLQTAKDMLRGSMDLLEGCRLIVRHHGVLEEASDPIFVPLVGIESETDDLTGKTDVWDPDTKVRIEQEKARYLHQVREEILESCANIVRKLNRPGPA